MALVLAAAAGWWILRAPLVDHGAAMAAAIEPDSFVLAAAARASAATPRRAGSSGAPLVASAASVPSGVEPSCGYEERPTFVERFVPRVGRVRDQSRGPGPTYIRVQAAIDAALRASSDPFDRVAADYLNVGEMRTPAGRIEAVAQQAVETTDPRVYGLAFGLCARDWDAAPSCTKISAGRWTELEPDNGIAWLHVLDFAHVQGDAAGVQEAMARMAAARHFDQRLYAVAGVVAARLPTDPRSQAAAFDLVDRATKMASDQESSPIALFQICRPNAGATVARQCKTISESVFDHADDVRMRAAGAVLNSDATGDATKRDEVYAEQFSAASENEDTSECRRGRDNIQLLLRIAQVGEYQARRERSKGTKAP